jgi:DNA-binding LacI/PurR family transcriptional regulator
LGRSRSTPQDGKVTSHQPAKRAQPNAPVRLKELAHFLGLDPSTISFVLNDTPGRSIPEETRKRVRDAAKEFNYQPNLVARSFRNRRTLTLGVLVPELSDGYHTEVLTGVGDCLLEAGYSYLTAHHRHRPELVEQYSKLLIGRGAEGMICIDTSLEHVLPIPAVVVAGHQCFSGVTNVVLNHQKAAELTLTHLHALGHRRVAFMRGQPFSGDSEDRWQAIVRVSRKMGIEIQPDLTVQLEKDISWPELGYPVTRNLFAAKRSFTALVCFNDVAAIGAIRAIRDQGLRVPEDISVIGFDDIKAAAYMSPSLTTIRQPLAEMGRAAAQCIINRLNRTEDFREVISFKPELVIRESTSQAMQKTGLRHSKTELGTGAKKSRSSVNR